MQADEIKGCGSLLAYPFFISYFIINAFIVLDLSIGVFVGALSDLKKMQHSLFNQKQINNFLELWSDYDPDSTGWIHVDQLLFLIFELPIPFGAGKVTPDYHSALDFDILYNNRIKENKFVLKAQQKVDKSPNLEYHEINRIEVRGQIYLINESKGLTIKETRATLLVKDHYIPIYEGNVVHFRDVFQQIIRNAFEHTKEDYQPNPKLQAKFEKKWKKGIKKKHIKLSMVDEYMAGRMLYNKYKLKLDKRNK